MKILSNPYHNPDAPVPMRKLVAAVGDADWERIYLAHPFRGVQDVVISSLIHKFAQAVKDNHIPPYYDPDNASRLASLLRGTTFPRVD